MIFQKSYKPKVQILLNYFKTNNNLQNCEMSHYNFLTINHITQIVIKFRKIFFCLQIDSARLLHNLSCFLLWVSTLTI